MNRMGICVDSHRMVGDRLSPTDRYPLCPRTPDRTCVRRSPSSRRRRSEVGGPQIAQGSLRTVTPVSQVRVASSTSSTPPATAIDRPGLSTSSSSVRRARRPPPSSSESQTRMIRVDHPDVEASMQPLLHPACHRVVTDSGDVPVPSRPFRRAGPSRARVADRARLRAAGRSCGTGAEPR